MASRSSLQLELPAPLRLLNGALAQLAPSSPSLSFDAFARITEAAVGLSDWGTDEQRRRFERGCEALEANQNVTPWGRICVRGLTHWKMANHLLRVDFVKKHPHVREIPIEAPIVILGWYRTGTTLLHNLFGADGENRLPITWEIASPTPFVSDPVRDREYRRAATALILSANRYVIPDQASAHHLTIDGPEECFFLFENAGVSTTFMNTYQAYDNGRELASSDQRLLYEDHKLQLQILSMSRPKKRWVLKCPFHLWTMDSLLDVYPDARVVQTHREAEKSLPSNCSLSAMTTSKFVTNFDLHTHGRFWADFYRLGIDRGLLARARLPANRIADVRMSDLSRDPVAAMRGVYEKFDMPWSPELELAVRTELPKHPKDAHGKHRYDLATFGLDEAEIAARFRDYHERFGLVTPSRPAMVARDGTHRLP
jgi:hypothetical protein